MNSNEKLAVLQDLLNKCDPTLVASAEELLAGIRRQFVGDPAGLVEVLNVVSVSAALNVATIKKSLTKSSTVIH